MSGEPDRIAAIREKAEKREYFSRSGNLNDADADVRWLLDSLAVAERERQRQVRAAFHEGWIACANMGGTLSEEECWSDSQARAALLPSPAAQDQ
jgi:hypothetical protein